MITIFKSEEMINWLLLFNKNFAKNIKMLFVVKKKLEFLQRSINLN